MAAIPKTMPEMVLFIRETSIGHRSMKTGVAGMNTRPAQRRRPSHDDSLV
jgi:hypothetical protein